MRAYPVWKADIRLYVYRLSVDGASEEYTDESEESVSSCSQWVLPAKEFDGLWENLIYDIDIKQSLVQYCSTALLFSDQSVNTNIISWNRVVLLHGPPELEKLALQGACTQDLHSSLRSLSKRFAFRNKCSFTLQ